MTQDEAMKRAFDDRIANLLSEIRAAFDGQLSAPKNIALRRAADAIATLTRERDNWKAHAISRGKRLRQARDRFICIKDEIEDEGDRVYFGSSNHADEFREKVAWLDDFKWDKIMGEPEDWDLLGALKKQIARADKAEAYRDAALARAEAADDMLLKQAKYEASLRDQLKRAYARTEAAEKELAELKAKHEAQSQERMRFWNPDASGTY
jgi:hypothetical protein